MIAIFTLLLVVIVSLLINRVATVALVFTGMSRDSARFQARSAFSGAGFTTSESEQIVGHPVRRRIVMLLMLLGNAGFVTMIATLLGGFIGVGDVGNSLKGVEMHAYDDAGQEQSDMTFRFDTGEPEAKGFVIEYLFGESRSAQIMSRGLLLMLGLLVVWAIANSTWVDDRMFVIIAWALQRFTHLDTVDYHAVFRFAEGFQVEEITIGEDHWATARSLMELRVGDEGLQVLGIVRVGGDYIGSPMGQSYLRSGDTVIVYGCAEALRSFRHRKKGDEGQAEHQQRVLEQLGRLVDQTQDERSEEREGVVTGEHADG